MSFPMYADEDSLNRDLVAALRRLGVDVRTVYEEHTGEQSDEAQLEHARKLGRVIYTSNIGDYCRLHAEYVKQNREHGGIIVIKQNAYGIGEQARRILNLQTRFNSSEMRNRLEFLGNW